MKTLITAALIVVSSGLFADEAARVQQIVSNLVGSAVGRANIEKIVVNEHKQYPGKQEVVVFYKYNGDIKDALGIQAATLVRTKAICRIFANNYNLRNVELLFLNVTCAVNDKYGTKKDHVLMFAKIPVEAIKKIAVAPEIEIGNIMSEYLVKGAYFNWASFAGQGFHERYYAQ